MLSVVFVLLVYRGAYAEAFNESTLLGPQFNESTQVSGLELLVTEKSVTACTTNAFTNPSPNDPMILTLSAAISTASNTYCLAITGNNIRLSCSGAARIRCSKITGTITGM